MHIAIGGREPAGAYDVLQVVVANRQDCCQDSLDSFSLVFLNASGRQDRATYRFAGAKLSYTITGEHRRRARALAAARTALIGAASQGWGEGERGKGGGGEGGGQGLPATPVCHLWHT
jgi:hypothetical protein